LPYSIQVRRIFLKYTQLYFVVLTFVNMSFFRFLKKLPRGGGEKYLSCYLSCRQPDYTVTQKIAVYIFIAMKVWNFGIIHCGM
jgi:hypothetical protein